VFAALVQVIKTIIPDVKLEHLGSRQMKNLVFAYFLSIKICTFVLIKIVFSISKILFTMNLQYITDAKGRKSAVQLPLKDWERIIKDLEEFERLKDKQLFFLGLKDAFEEVKLIKKGKKKPNSLKALIDELRDNSDK
jgi:hypothetical protein